MSIREQITLLEELASIDNDIRRINERLEKQRGNLEGMRSELLALEARIKTDRESLGSIEKTRGELSTEIRQMAQQIERSREKLGRSRNEREQMAAQREMEELRRLHRDREEELERLTSSCDGLRGTIDSTEARRGEIRRQLDGTEEGIATSILELESEKKTREGARAQVQPRIPTALYRRYESIRTRRPMAIAKTHDGTCLGCHLSVPPMMFQKMLRQDEFEQCPQCKRILYYVPPTAASSPARESIEAGADPSRA